MTRVSVCTVTYNHGPYIAQAIESVLMQRCPDIEVEMVIGDDVSSDNTREIIADYARRFPENIKPLFHPQNLGPGANTRACMSACTGEFVAALEGDDYWTDPDKLRRQVAALQRNPTSALCFHDATVRTEGSSVSYLFSEKYSSILSGETEKVFTQADIVRLGWFMPTASLLWRRETLPQPLPEWWPRVFSGDYTLQLLITRHGSALYLPQVMSVYRLHEGGVMRTSHNTLAQNKRRIFENELYKTFLPSELHPHIDKYLENLYFERSEKMGAEGVLSGKLYYYGKAITINWSRLFIHLERLTRRVVGMPPAKFD